MQISDNLPHEDYQVIQEMLNSLPNGSNVNLDQMWQLMDKVWDEMGCDNINLDKERINSFYKHQIWLLNGFFIEQHELSLQHRHAISDWIVQNIKNTNTNVLDFGGGFGTLARIIVSKSELLDVDIYEPYPSDFAISQCLSYPRIRFISDLQTGKYNYLVSTDVLEHVPDPLELFGKMIESVNINGYLIIANCFYPVIKCHLPSTFHLRYSFHEFAEMMGLKNVGMCEGSHATIYQKISNKDIDWDKIRKMESRSRKLYGLKEFEQKNISPWKYRFKRLITDPLGLLKSVKKKFVLDG